jgi:hypothetical protein
MKQINKNKNQRNVTLNPMQYLRAKPDNQFGREHIIIKSPVQDFTNINKKRINSSLIAKNEQKVSNNRTLTLTTNTKN